MHKLTKISRPEVEGGLRTDSVVGQLQKEAVVGESLFIVGKALDPNMDIRVVNTSPIIDIKINGNVKLLRTMTGSVYRLEEIAGD